MKSNVSSRRDKGLKASAAMNLLFVVLAILLIHPAPAMAQLMRGDTNADGVIDGRDALQIMRAVQGLESPDADTIQRADIHPFPGTNDREVGDGILTRADAEKILKYTVGLASEGELTADYAHSAPRIDDFTPSNGPVGTRVTISGANFVPGMAAENVVLFGGVKAHVLEVDSTRIIAEVPAGAITGAIRVRTAGGSAVSTGQFTVTTERAVVLELDGGLNPGDFVLTSGYAETDTMQADGGFRLLLPERRLALVGAVPKIEGNNCYLTVYLPADPHTVPSHGASPLTLNARTTAATLVFMHPFFLTKNPATAAWLLDLIESLPETEVLAQTIAEKYPQGADGLNDSAVGEAWDKAVIALLDALPSGHVQSLNQDQFPSGSGNAAKGNKRISGFSFITDSTPHLLSTALQRPPSFVPRKSLGGDLSALPTKIMNIDSCYIAASYVESTHAVLPELAGANGKAGYSPVDWVVTLYRIDPQRMPLGINEGFPQLATRPLLETEYRLTTVVPANQWTAKIDILYTLIDSGMNSIIDFFVPHGNGLKLESSFEDGVYMLRAYSGAVYAPNPSD